MTQIVTNGVDAPPPIKVQQVTIDGLPVQVVDGRVLVRAGATNRCARPREVAALASVA